MCTLISIHRAKYRKDKDRKEQLQKKARKKLIETICMYIMLMQGKCNALISETEQRGI